MAGYYENLKRFGGGSTFTPDTSSTQDDFYIDKSLTLEKDDLKKYEYLNPIRDYMIERKGVDYRNASEDEVVDDFVQHMRYFNANSVSTAGELRFINKANDQRRNKARKAYEIYEQLGNVFQNDGVMGAVDGVKDYIFAAAKDPTNYLGLITGGVARAGVAGVSLTGKQVVRSAVREAGRKALQDGASKKAAVEAAKKAGKEAAARAIKSGTSKRQASKVADGVVNTVEKDGRRFKAQEAMRKNQSEFYESAAKRSLKQTIALDAGAAVLQDVMAQTAYIEAGAQEQYSKTQTAFSSLLGGVAGAAQLGFGMFRGSSGFEDSGTTLEGIANAVIDNNTAKLTAEESKEAAKLVKDTVKSWNDKVEAGYEINTAVMPSDLVRTIVIGEDGKSGLAKLLNKKGMKIHGQKKVSDIITNVARFIPEEDLVEINKGMKKYTDLQLGELTEDGGTELRDLLAKDISEAGKTLAVMSQARKLIDGGIVAAGDKSKRTYEDDIADAVREQNKMKKSEPLKYGQSVWKRLLVSSPATTMINVAGFSQYYVGQTMADLFNSTMLGFKALGQATVNPNAARETMRQARALTMIQGQKMRNLLDPYTTHDAYLKFLDDNESARKSLFETMAGGVEATADRYNINPDSKVFRNVEAFATAASQVTGVRIQDSFTKSQMFMTEMDKFLRVNKGVTLKEALLEADDFIDEEIVQGALDSTLKSVFAKDYTTTEQPELLRTAAKFAESFSNTPGLGTLLPFGRFFNNVVATAYQWSPLAAPQQFAKFTKNLVKGEPDVTDRDAFARMLVGSTALRLSMDYDNERKEQGLGVYEVNVGGGTIVDAKNTFPFSLWLAAGRILNNIRNGEQVPPELQQELGTQLVVGQLARDAQFANDINNLLDVLTNVDEGARAASVDGFYKVGGNFVSGFTRPLDAINKTIGFAMGTDNAKDVRQAEGMNVFTQSATKYVDNIIEAFIDKTDTITGEDLEVATRSGKVYDANPFARIFGITVKPGRTATEKAYSMAEMFPWRANERTKIPAYDKAFNGLVAPMLEVYTQQLLDDPKFQSASLTQKRGMLKARLSDIKSIVRERMEKGYTGSENAVLRRAAKAAQKYNKETTREALKLMKEQTGVTGSLEDLTYKELELFMIYAEYLKDIQEEAGRL